MTKGDVSIIGKFVKDMYGTTIGNVLGTLTHIDGKIQTVGIDCGSEGLKQIQRCVDEMAIQTTTAKSTRFSSNKRNERKL